MIALPIALLLFGYWVMYGGVKRTSLADAWSCLSQQQATAAKGSEGVVTKPVSNCAPQPGDTRLPGGYIWRPLPASVNQALAGGALGFAGFLAGQVAGELIGPC